LGFLVYMFSTSALLLSLGLVSASLAGHCFAAAIVFFFIYQFVPDTSMVQAAPKLPAPSSLRNVPAHSLIHRAESQRPHVLKEG
jgi:hypothetical protein